MPVETPYGPLPVFAVVPARGGSKGIPRKNLRPLGGRPLVAHTLEAARRSRAVDRVFCNTDDPAIARAAEAAGAEVPELRPAELATDCANLDQAMGWFFALLERRYAPVFIQIGLMPTYPFRRPEDLEVLVEKILAGHRWVESVARPRSDPRLYLADGTGRLEAIGPAFGRGPWYLQRGSMAGSYHGAAPGPLPPAAVVLDPVRSIDIDRPEDLALAERAIARGLDRELPPLEVLDRAEMAS